MRTAIAILLLAVTVSPSIPQKWKVSYVNDIGFIQWQYVPGHSIEDALDYLYWVDPGAHVLTACHTDYAECEAKGEERVPPVWRKSYIQDK